MPRDGRPDDALDDDARERIKRRLVRVVLEHVDDELHRARRETHAKGLEFDAHSTAEAALTRCERAFVNARARRGETSAADRRDGRVIAGRALARACGGWGGGVTARAASALAGADAAATRRLMRAMHAEGRVISQGAIAEEEAFEVVSDGRSGVLGARWLARVEGEYARATRFARRALGLTRRGRGGGGDGDDDDEGDEGDEMDGGDVGRDVQAAVVARDADDGAFDLVDEWLQRGASSDDDDDDDDDEAKESEDDAREDDGIGDVHALEAMDAAPSNETEDGDPEPTAFIPVEGAEVRDVEQDNEYFIREIMSLQGASDAEIAQRIHANVELTKGAENSVSARRALMMQSLFKKFGRKDTARASHTGATVRESSSTNPRHKFFAQTENKTRIESRNKSLEFRSVNEYVRTHKEVEEARARRVKTMLL